MMFNWEQLCLWLLIAGGIGCAGELMAGRHRLLDLLEASAVALLAVLLLVGIFHFHFKDELIIMDVPLLSTVLIAALVVSLWSTRAYQR
jgi:hypothetical protein